MSIQKKNIMKRSSLRTFLDNNALLFIIILGLIIRMSFFISLKPWNTEVLTNTVLVFDAGGYHELALNLLSNKSFEDFSNFRTPGYPVFIALLYAISFHSVWFVLLAQLLLNLVSLVLVFKISFLLFNRKIALFAALLFALDVHQALYAVTLLSDSLFVLFFLASIYYLCRGLMRVKMTDIAFSAIFLGVATLVRPITFLLPIVVAFIILIYPGLNVKSRLISIAGSLIVYFLIILPWILYNGINFGQPKLASISGFNLLYYNVAYTEVYKTGKPIEQVYKEFDEMAVKLGADTTDRTTFKNSDIYTGIAKQYISDNLWIYAKRNIMGIINMYAGLATQSITSVFHLKSKSLSLDQFSGPGIFARIMDFFKSKSMPEIAIALFLTLYLIFNYVFAMSGFVHYFRQNIAFALLFLLILIYFSGLTGVVGLARYRLPIMPIINIVAAVGIFNISALINKNFNYAWKKR